MVTGKPRKLEDRFEKLYRILRGELIRFAVGSRFYSLREMVRRFGASNRVAVAVAGRMVREGLLERRERSGYYVRSVRFHRSVVQFYWEEVRKGQKVVQELRDSFKTLGEYEVVGLTYQDDVSLRGMIESCSADVIVISWVSHISFEVLIWASQLAKTVIFEGRDLRDMGMHCFYDDAGYNALLALNCFRRNGHRRIGVLLAEPPYGGFSAICENLTNFARLTGCETVWIPCSTSHEFNPVEWSYQALSDHLVRYGLNFTGLFVITGSACTGVLRALSEQGWSVPDDVSVVGFEGAEYCAFLSPAISVVGGNGVATGRARAVAIHRYLSNPSSGVIQEPYRAVFVDRGSIRKINTNQ